MTTSNQNPNGLALDCVAAFLTNPSAGQYRVLTLDSQTGRVGLVPLPDVGVSVPTTARAADLFPIPDHPDQEG